MTDEERKDLREKAEAAKQDVDPEWKYIDGPLMGDVCVDTKPTRPGSTFRYLRVGTGPLGPFIAAADPTTVIALLDRIESLEQTAQRRLDDLVFHAEQLAAMTAARDEACKLMDAVGRHGKYDGEWQTWEERISTLRKVGAP